MRWAILTVLAACALAPAAAYDILNCPNYVSDYLMCLRGPNPEECCQQYANLVAPVCGINGLLTYDAITLPEADRELLLGALLNSTCDGKGDWARLATQFRSEVICWLFLPSGLF